MSLCDSCKYQYYVEQLKPCIIRRVDCEFYEADDFYEEPKTEKVIKMRDATLEEQKSVDDYIKSISKPTDVDFWDLEQKPKIGYCKDCKWWKDSDGAYRRGIGAESQCPMNRIEVYEGNGYCFLFEPQESEDGE